MSQWLYGINPHHVKIIQKNISYLCHAEFIWGNIKYNYIISNFSIQGVEIVPCSRQGAPLYGIFKAMAGDDLVMQGARSLVAMILT